MHRALRLLLKSLLGLILVLVLLVAGVAMFMPGVHSSSIAMILNVMTGSSANSSPTI